MALVLKDLVKIIDEYTATIQRMDTMELIEYTLIREHCQPLERELALRLKRFIEK